MQSHSKRKDIFLCYVKSPGNFYCTMIIGNRSSLSTSSISTSLSLFFCLLWTCLCVRNCFLLPKDFPQSSHLCTSCVFMCLFRSFFALNFLLQITQMDSMCCCMCFFKRYSFGFRTKHLWQTKLAELFPICCLLTC